MKPSPLIPDFPSEVVSAHMAAQCSRWTDYVMLAKPRISFLVLFTVGAGVLLASGLQFSISILIHAVVGTAIVATGASALNQWLEIDTDSLMRRTQNRPLPTGRLDSLEVLLFGCLCGLLGTSYLIFLLPNTLPGLLAAFTFLTYVFIYTPLKKHSSLNTLVGAIPGAMPPLIGWTAVRGEISVEGIVLFMILFVWQIPHFLAIAWMYKDEYRKAGLQMLPISDPDGRATGRQMIYYCLALVSVSIMPVFLHTGGWIYLVGALWLGWTFTLSSFRFFNDRTFDRAKQVLRTSIIYLPGLLAMLILDRALDSIFSWY
ncbi:MAG: heme o synthase [Gemmataceae bacterium]